MLQTKANPFRYDGPVSEDQGEFVIPELSLPSSIDDLMSGRCCLIMGPPASGTTSYLISAHKQYLQRVPEAIWWDIDLNSLVEKTTIDFYQYLSENGRTIFGNYKGIWDAVENLDSFFDALYKSISYHPRQVILAFDHIEKKPFDIVSETISLVHHMNSNRSIDGFAKRLVTAIMAGSVYLHRQGVIKGSPLYFASRHYTEDYSLTDVVNRLVEPGFNYQWKFEYPAAKMLTEETNGSKYLLQKLAHDLVEQSFALGYNSVREKEVRESIKKFTNGGFLKDKIFCNLIPSLIRDENSLELLKQIDNNPVQGANFNVIRYEIEPNLNQLFKRQGDYIVVRNNIFKEILRQHRPILNSVNELVIRQEKKVRRILRLQQLNLENELVPFGHDRLCEILEEVRGFLGIKDVILLQYDEAGSCFNAIASAHGTLTISFCLPSDIVKNMSDIELLPFTELLYPDAVTSLVDPSTAIVSYLLPLIESGTKRLVGVLILAGFIEDLSSEIQCELKEFATNIAEALYTKQFITGLQIFSQVPLEATAENTYKKFCESIEGLFNKPFVFLWKGNPWEQVLPLAGAAGMTTDEYFEAIPWQEVVGKVSQSIIAKKLVHFGDNTDYGNGFISRLNCLDVLSILFLGVILPNSSTIAVLGIGSRTRWEPQPREAGLAEIITKLSAVMLSNQDTFGLINNLLDSFSHEVRTNINQISAWLNLILENTKRDEDRYIRIERSQIRRIFDNANRLGLITDNLIDCLRLNSGVLYQENSNKSFATSLIETIEQLKSEVERKDSRLIVNLPERLPLQQVHPYFLQMILGNLIQNSLLYAKSKEIFIQVDVTQEKTIIDIHDVGPGIQPDRIPFLFKQWMHGAKGIGLGLYIVDRFMRVLGGEVRFDSTYIDGARFLLYFPFGEGQLT